MRAFHARQLERAGANANIQALERRGVLRGVVVSSHRTEVVCDVYEARGDDLPMASLLGEELPIAALTYNGSEWRGSLENLDRARRCHSREKVPSQRRGCQHPPPTSG